jgi:hypothetical protein
MILKLFKYLLVLFVLEGCSQNSTNIQPSKKTKIKRITIYPNYRSDTAIADTFKYDFYYDGSHQKLTEVKLNDSDYIQINNYNQNTILIEETLRFLNGDIIVKQSYAHLNANNRIVSIGPMPDIVYPIIAAYNGNNIDTIYQADFFPIWNGFNFYFLMSNINTFNFVYQNQNCVQAIVSYKNRQNFGSIGVTKDTNALNMTYNTNLLNIANLIPMQSVYNDLFAGANNWIDYSYILGVSGYHFTKPNQNLIQTSDFFIGYNNNRRFYEYQSDVSGNILEMCVKENSTISTCTKFKFEYY